MRTLLLALAATALVATDAVGQATRSAPALAADVAAAHGRDRVPDGQVLVGEFDVAFGDNVLLDSATIHFTPNVAKIRIETNGGTVAVFDGTTAYVTPGDDLPRPRFQLVTWPYFAMLPFKLDDPGTGLAAMEPAPMRDGEPMRRGKLAFDAGVGDSPDDWYVLYINDNDVLEAAAYTVTYGKTVTEAEADPHAIVYGDFVDVPDADGEATGVVVSTSWTFYDWSPDGGIADETIGTATISDLRFVSPEPGLFDRPEGSTEVEAPE